MAGDVPAAERLLLVPAGTDDDTPKDIFDTGRPGTRRLEAEQPLQGGPAEQVVHRYGRVQILSLPAQGPPASARARGPQPGEAARPGGIEPPTGLDQAGELDEVEALGLAAFLLRESAAYVDAKAIRPRAEELWDMAGACTDIAPPPETTGGGNGARTATAGEAEPAGAGVAEEAPAEAGAAEGRAPTSAYLEGSVAVGLVLVEGPTEALQFTTAERTKIVAEVQNGLSWLGTQNPAADISFTYDIQVVRLPVPPDPGAQDLEAHWRNPAMARLGVQPNFNGVYTYVERLRSRLATQWAYCAYFTKYPVPHFAYAAIGGPRLVMTYENDGWGPDNIDRVFAHETSHIFGAVDEYASSRCDCGGTWGRFRVRNGNCAACAPSPATCLMLANSFQFCNFTPAHVGWGRGVAGNPALVQSTFGRQGNFDVVVPSAFAGITHFWRDNDTPGFPWREPFQTAHSAGRFDALTMVQSNLTAPGPLEVVARSGGDLSFLWRDGTTFTWRDPVRIAQGVDGVPSLVQSRLGGRGNFELLVPAADVGILHMWRNHDAYGFPWSAPRLFAANLGHVAAVSLVHGSRGGGAGVLEAVAGVGTRLVHLWRDHSTVWRTTVVFAEGVRGNPALVESRFGADRNFEVVVGLAGGGLAHFYRNNSAPGTPWSPPRPFAAALGPVDAVTMIQSNFNGNLEVVARVGDRLFHIWRSSGPGATWSHPRRIF